MQIIVGVSNRHVHLTKGTFIKLFGHSNLEVRNELKQPGQYASKFTVDIKYNQKIILHVRIVGPFREYNQIEIAQSDAKLLNVNPPRKQSGDLEGSLPITIIGPLAEIDLPEGLILDERHIHLSKNECTKLKLQNKEEVKVYHNGTFIFNAKIKSSLEAYPELHIDKDEEEIYNLHAEEQVTFSKL